jgi:glycine/serine hydroxymethyltransferase
MKEKEMLTISQMISQVLRKKGEKKTTFRIRKQVKELAKQFPFYLQGGRFNG